MKSFRNRRILPSGRIPVLVLALVLLLSSLSAAEGSGGGIIVSLGDSYSSGEGIPPFYFQDLPFEEKIKEDDWIAHRSTLSWSGRLKLPSVEGTMADHKGENWFFVAVSGATTRNYLAGQEIRYDRHGLKGSVVIPPQLEIFDTLRAEGKQADYVTMTIGGNDMGFVSMLIGAVISGGNYDALENHLTKVWNAFPEPGGVRDMLRQAYLDVEKAAGKQARILVAGYPLLFDPKGGLIVSKSEAKKMDDACARLNREIREIVDELRSEGVNIYFVSVEEQFAGHGIYSDDPYINDFILHKNSEDLRGGLGVSSYSVHPNEKGAQAYAEAVQEKIDELEGIGKLP